MRQSSYFFAIFSIALLCSLVFAESFPVPEGDPLAGLAQLIFNYKTLAPLAAVSSGIVVAVQMCRKYLPSSNVAQMLADFLAVAYAVVEMLVTGESAGAALVHVLLLSGGAMFLYNKIFKHFFEKQSS